MDSSRAWQDSPYLMPLCIAAIIAAALTILAWRRRHAPGAYAFGGLTLAIFVWSIGYAAELSRADPLSALLWTKVQYLGIVSAPVLWLIFILETTGHSSRATRRRALGLFGVPLITLALAWTNERHGLIWSTVGWSGDGRFAMLQVRYGAWFWVHTAYSYALILLGSIALARALLHAPHLYRGQTSSLLIGASAPWMANIVYLAGLNPFPHLDLTPLAFTITGIAFARGLLRFRLLDIVPIARGLVVESMSEGVVVLDALDRVVDLNQAAQQTLGWTAAEAIGRDVAQVFAAWPHVVERYRWTTKVSEEVVVGEDQEQHAYDLRISPLYNRGNRLNGRLVVWRDITERKRVEAAARRQAQELELIDQVRVALVESSSLQALFRIVVERIAAAFGYTLVSIYILQEDQLYLQYQVGYPSMIPAIPISEGVMGRVVRTAEPIVLADVRDDPTFVGAIEEIESEICVPLFDRGQVAGVLNVESTRGVRLTGDDLRLLLVLCQSISTAIERKRGEEALAEAKDAAEAASRAKSAFLANMSHELRTPLSAIMGYSQLLELEAEALGYDGLLPDLANIKTAGAHLLALISDVLDFSKIEAGKLTLDRERFELPNLLSDVVATIQPLIERNNNRLELDCAYDVDFMVGDPTKLKQVLLNLLGNAAKFTESGTITLRVTSALVGAAEPGCEHAGDAQPRVMFEVRDSGIGMAPEQVRQLFQPFIQVGSTIARVYGGTGLGLALSRRLCQMMGGEIVVTSQLGAGSTFTVCLPAIAAEPVEAPGSAAEERNVLELG